jgi:hypothetical protein
VRNRCRIPFVSSNACKTNDNKTQLRLQVNVTNPYKPQEQLNQELLQTGREEEGSLDIVTRRTFVYGGGGAVSGQAYKSNGENNHDA